MDFRSSETIQLVEFVYIWNHEWSVMYDSLNTAIKAHDSVTEPAPHSQSERVRIDCISALCSWLRGWMERTFWQHNISITKWMMTFQFSIVHFHQAKKKIKFFFENSFRAFDFFVELTWINSFGFIRYIRKVAGCSTKNPNAPLYTFTKATFNFTKW